MRIPSSVFAVGRYALVLCVIAGSVALVSADKKASFSPHDKAYYLDPAVIEYVQPGLTFTVVSANIASNGTVTVDYKVADASGAALDLAGVVTPGAITPHFLLAYMAKGNTWFTSYWQSSSTNATTGFVTTRASGDTGGTSQTVAVGEYIYTFGNKLPAGFDTTVTNRLGIYGSRNLTTWDLGTANGDTWYDFVPNGAKVTVTRDIIRTASCNQCHDSLSFHGGSRRSLQLCIICHQPQTIDSNGNSADMKVMAHKIHMGSQLPSVIAGGTYVLGSTDWSTVVLPSNPERCTFCHQSTATTGATQPDNWKTNPSRAACGSCHDDVNFATGQNHVNLPQANDAQCSQCHQPTGQEFDASITGAHTIAVESATAPGINLAITKVTNGVAGKAPTVTFTIKDNSGAGIPMSQMTTTNSRLALVMAGPTSDYGYTSFGSDVTTPGYVSENPVPTASCGSDGTCTYTFTHAIPAKATGTYAIGIEGRRGLTLDAGTVLQQTTEYGAINKVTYFSVDGSPVVPRRTVVALANCNNCHARLSLHGENRNQIEMCVLCHNPTENDLSTRPSSTVASDKALPPQSVNFALMIHKIHTGVNLATFNQTYIVVGYGGSHNDFSTVRYPAMSPSGAVHDTTNCAMCHVNGSEAVLPIGKNAVIDQQGLLSPSPATTSACTACHLNPSAFGHAVSNTDPKFGESCAVCHGTGASYDASQVHAGM
jgi:OmcA/MtrC family decaheme c-type cytochrome